MPLMVVWGLADVCAARADACLVYAAEALWVAARVRIRHTGRGAAVLREWGSGSGEGVKFALMGA